MPTHADKRRSAATEFSWWLAWPFLGIAAAVVGGIARAVRRLARRAVELWGDLIRPAAPDEPSRAERWLMVGLTVLALAWAVMLAVAG